MLQVFGRALQVLLSDQDLALQTLLLGRKSSLQVLLPGELGSNQIRGGARRKRPRSPFRRTKRRGAFHTERGISGERTSRSWRGGGAFAAMRRGQYFVPLE